MSKKTIIITSSIIGVLALIGLIFIFVIDKNVKTYNVSFETNGGTAVDSQKVKQVINETGATSMKDMGVVMKKAKEKIGASADGKTINEVVKELLN